MMNLTNTENLALASFESSLAALLSFTRDEDQAQLDILEDPRGTVKRLRKLLDDMNSSSAELRVHLLGRLPAGNIRQEEAHKVLQQQLKEVFRSQAAKVGQSTNADPVKNYVAPPSTTAPLSPGSNLAASMSGTALVEQMMLSPSARRRREMEMRATAERERRRRERRRARREEAEKEELRKQQQASATSASFFLPSISVDTRQPSSNPVRSQSGKRESHRHRDHHRHHRGSSSSSSSSDSSSSGSSDGGRRHDAHIMDRPRVSVTTSSADYYSSAPSQPMLSSPGRGYAQSTYSSAGKHQIPQQAKAVVASSSSSSPRLGASSKPMSGALHQDNHPHHGDGVTASSSLRQSMPPLTPTQVMKQYLSYGSHFLLELVARATLAREVILYRCNDPSAVGSALSLIVVNVFCCRPSIAVWDEQGADSLVGRVVTCGVAVNVAPTFPSMTNTARLVLPIFATAKRTAVVGAIALNERASGSCFSEADEALVAAVCELSAFLIQPPAYLKPPVSGAMPCATSLLPAVLQLLPNRSRVVRNILNPAAATPATAGTTTMATASSTSHAPLSPPATPAAAGAAAASSAPIAAENSSPAFLFDPHESGLKQWSAHSLLDSVQNHYLPHFAELRAQKVRAELKQHQQIISTMTKGAGGAVSRHNNANDHEDDAAKLQRQLLPHMHVDQLMNTTIHASLLGSSDSGSGGGGNNNSSTASSRVLKESPAHKFLLKMCAKLYEDHHKEQLLRSDLRSDNGSASMLASMLRRSSSAVSFKEMSGAGYDFGGSSGDGGVVHDKQRLEAERKRKIALEQFGQELSRSGMLSPDTLADMVDSVKVPLMIVRTVHQNVTSSASSSLSSPSNNNNNNNCHGSVSSSAANHHSPSARRTGNASSSTGLTWYPSSSSPSAFANVFSTGCGASHSKDHNSNRDNNNINNNNNNSYNSHQHPHQQGQQQQHQSHGGGLRTTGSIGLAAKNIAATGHSESISATISTLHVLDVANHVRDLESGWRRSVEEMRSTDFQQISSMQHVTKLQQRLAVLERQKAEAEKREELTEKRYTRLREQIGNLVSTEVSSATIMLQQTSGAGGGGALSGAAALAQSMRSGVSSPRAQ